MRNLMTSSTKSLRGRETLPVKLALPVRWM